VSLFDIGSGTGNPESAGEPCGSKLRQPREPAQFGARSAEVVVNAYLKEGNVGLGFGRSIRRIELFFGDVVPNFYRFANLLEVAATAGYVDLGEIPFQKQLHEALIKFIESEQKSESPGDLTLIEGLNGRLRGASALSATSFDRNAFYGYAAYLALADRVNRDEHLQSHLAELLTLQDRFKGVDGLYAKALRCAHWAHAVVIFERRMHLWSERMRDRVSADEADSRENEISRLNVLEKMRSAMLNEGLAEVAERHVVSGEPPAEVSAEDLILQGRFGTARARIRELLSAKWPDSASSDLGEFVFSSIQLAEAGAPDEAAVWIDRVVSRFGGEFNSFCPIIDRSSRGLCAVDETAPKGASLQTSNPVTP
jgi:hypothetical protein